MDLVKSSDLLPEGSEYVDFEVERFFWSGKEVVDVADTEERVISGEDGELITAEFLLCTSRLTLRRPPSEPEDCERLEMALRCLLAIPSSSESVESAETFR
jgi:hypothetical protein